MSWPTQMLSAHYGADNDSDGWQVTAHRWLTEGDYHDGLSTDELIALIRDPRSECRQVAIWVRRRKISDYTTPTQAIAILQSFPRAAEASMKAAAAQLDQWQPK